MKLKQLSVLALATLPVIAFAGISVSPLRVNFITTPAPGSSQTPSLYQDIKVFNNGDSTAYVNVTAYKMENPGTASEKLMPADSMSPSQFGLIVSPTKLIVNKDQSRIIRVMRVAHGNKQDLVYSIKVVPAKSLLNPIEQNKNIEAGVRIIVGYNVGVIIRPANPTYDVTVKQNGKQVTFHNAGNTSVVLANGKQCNAHGKDCKHLQAYRLYGNNSWTLDAPYNTPVSYDLLYMEKVVKQIKS